MCVICDTVQLRSQTVKMKRRQLKELFNRLLAVSANFLCHTDSVFLLYYSACNRKDD